jgi:hypothetical protein
VEDDDGAERAGADGVGSAGADVDGVEDEGVVASGAEGVLGACDGGLGVEGGVGFVAPPPDPELPGGASGCGAEPPEGAGSGSGPAATAQGVSASASATAPIEILPITCIRCTADNPSPLAVGADRIVSKRFGSSRTGSRRSYPRLGRTPAAGLRLRPCRPHRVALLTAYCSCMTSCSVSFRFAASANASAALAWLTEPEPPGPQTGVLLLSAPNWNAFASASAC